MLLQNQPLETTFVTSEKLRVEETGLFQYKYTICNLQTLVPCTSNVNTNPEVTINKEGLYIYVHKNVITESTL